MDRISGLRDYVKTSLYLEALGIPEDREIEYKMLAQGEYNINYYFVHPVTRRALVLRINTASQMNLRNQVEYEYTTLKLLEKSGRTPEVLYFDPAPENMEYGVIVMEFLSGRHLDYKSDLVSAAQCLADVHSVKVKEESHLISPEAPFQAVIDECREMIKTYCEYQFADENKKALIEDLLERGSKMARGCSSYKGYRCCINTELNSTNFLINENYGQDFLVDWEKPLYGDPAQDIGHFLAPTTTFWKTDIILGRKAMDDFISDYEKAVAGRFDTCGLRDRVNVYIPLNCLRGITWCAMAWVQYKDPQRLIANESTRLKLEQYLDMEFLQRIERDYF
ncbi:phosphotransferase family protein [Proteocatella sphenisci]|uniref:phosphotransferase family protein n=1 Tax=Proteocatella sphenisci TaxID=181070 RepID=UPI00048AA877|nr:aminoglycoside phosphotransferase family protein [Proteocatella sphenisci]